MYPFAQSMSANQLPSSESVARKNQSPGQRWNCFLPRMVHSTFYKPLKSPLERLQPFFPTLQPPLIIARLSESWIFPAQVTTRRSHERRGLIESIPYANRSKSRRLSLSFPRKQDFSQNPISSGSVPQFSSNFDPTGLSRSTRPRNRYFTSTSRLVAANFSESTAGRSLISGTSGKFRDRWIELIITALLEECLLRRATNLRIIIQFTITFFYSEISETLFDSLVEARRNFEAFVTAISTFVKYTIKWITQ